MSNANPVTYTGSFCLSTSFLDCMETAKIPVPNGHFLISEKRPARERGGGGGFGTASPPHAGVAPSEAFTSDTRSGRTGTLAQCGNIDSTLTPTHQARELELASQHPEWPSNIRAQLHVHGRLAVVSENSPCASVTPGNSNKALGPGPTCRIEHVELGAG